MNRLHKSYRFTYFHTDVCLRLIAHLFSLFIISTDLFVLFIFHAVRKWTISFYMYKPLELFLLWILYRSQKWWRNFQALSINVQPLFFNFRSLVQNVFAYPCFWGVNKSPLLCPSICKKWQKTNWKAKKVFSSDACASVHRAAMNKGKKSHWQRPFEQKHVRFNIFFYPQWMIYGSISYLKYDILAHSVISCVFCRHWTKVYVKMNLNWMSFKIRQWPLLQYVSSIF